VQVTLVLPSEWETRFCAILLSREYHEKENHMNLVTSLIGIAALSFITFALAHEEETASTTPEEKPSTRSRWCGSTAPLFSKFCFIREPGILARLLL